MNLEILVKIKEEAQAEKLPIIMDETAAEIEKVLLKYAPKRILEIGTAVGYSAAVFYNALNDKDVIIDTIEINEQRANTAKENMIRLGVQKNINVIFGNAVDILPTLKEDYYDFIFVDAAKGKYTIFLEESIKLIKNNGIILADNVLYKGYVLGDYNEHKHRTAVRNLRSFMSEIKENPKLETKILEIGDGISISKVKKEIF